MPSLIGFSLQSCLLRISRNILAAHWLIRQITVLQPEACILGCSAVGSRPEHIKTEFDTVYLTKIRSKINHMDGFIYYILEVSPMHVCKKYAAYLWSTIKALQL